MNGIIADVCFDLSLIEEGEGEGFYAPDVRGYLSLLGETLVLENCKFTVFTKVGDDNEAEAIKDWYSNLEIKYYKSDIYNTAISIDQAMRYRYSALYDIREDEIIDFISTNGIDTLFISAPLLSFKPVSREILKAVVREKNNLSSVIVDTSISYGILLLEELKECLETMLDEGVNLYMVGEALEKDKIKGMSSFRRDEILCPLNE